MRYELCSGIDPKDSTDVLDSAGGVEAEVLVQAESDVVTVETVSVETLVQEVLLEGSGDGGLG